MKIIFSNYDSLKNPFYGGGGAIAIHEIAKRLTRTHEVEVLTGRYPGSKDEVIEAVKYKRIGVFFLGPRLSQLLFSLTLPFYARLKNFDLWIESFTPPFSASFLPIFTSKPVIGLVHMLAGADMQRKYKLPFTLLENLGLRFYRYFIVVNETFKQKIQKINNKAIIKVIPNACDVPKGIVGKDKSTHILFIGRIEVNQKGLDLLLEAFKKISTKTKVKLVIAGGGSKSEEEKLKGLINKFSLSNKVRLVGRVSGRKKYELFKKALFVVVPSRYETFSMFALEAASFGLPVVSFENEGISWLPRSASVKVKNFNTQKFSERMLELISNPKLRIKIGKRAKKISKKFSWEKVLQEYKKFILRVCRKSSLPKETENFEKVLTKITEKKLHCFFISPHFDDAILSACGAILYLKRFVPLTVVNVFTEADDPPYTFSAKAHLKLCGVDSARLLYEKRKKQDRRALARLNLKPVNLGFVEALYRKRGSQNIFTRLIPELGHIYPVYRLSILGGRVSIEDRVLKKDLEKSLKKIIREPDMSCIFCPAGIGGHVDHILVRDVCWQNFKNIIFWADFPYRMKVLEYPNLGKGIRTYEFKNIFKETKSKLMSYYGNQIKGNLCEVIVPEMFFIKKDLSF